MKFTASQKSLHAACKLLGKIAKPRNPSAILSSVKAEPVDDGDGKEWLQLSATDNETAMELTIDVEWGKRDEPAMLPLAMISQIVAASLDESITIDVSSEKCIVSSPDGSRYELFTMGADGYPPRIATDSDATFEISAETLARLIRHTEFATAKQDTKYAITGISLEVDQAAKTMTLAATDTRRCAVATGALTVAGKLTGHPIIPQHALDLLSDLLTDDEEAVTFTLSDKRVEFTVGRAVLGARLLEGRFPPYEDIVPKKFKHTIDLPTGALLSRVGQAEIVTDDEHRVVAFEFEKNKLTLKAETSSAGLSEISLPCVYGGPAFKMNFHPEYIMEFLQRVDEETVQLQIEDEKKPGMFRAGEGNLYLVMPIR